MSFTTTKLTTAMATAGFALLGSGLAAQEITYMCSSDGTECATAREIFDRFEAENPGVTVVVDEVPYKAILESLPVQLAAGTGPDMAKVTDLGGLSQYYLDLSPYVDAQYWEDSFGGTLDWYRKGADDNGIYGLHSQLTITGGYANKTLFDQAGIEMPGGDATWDDWAAATRAVAEATGTDFPMAMDRSGHRIAGPAISYGAKLFDANGEGKLVDEGFTAYVQKFVDWHNDGTMARDVWAGSGGSSYQDAAQEFINGELVYYYSGSWNVAKMDDNIGDAFDWVVVGSPCGSGGCSGMPGGAGIVGFEGTEHPELVAKAIDYLAQEENYAEMTAKTKNIPAHLGVASKGVEYPGASEGAANALNAWAAQVAKVSPVAFQYQGYKNNRAMFNITVERVTQAIVGELSVEDAMARAAADLETALAEAN
ncbi:ABC transporter substrate-binding protein [Yoonia sediminilitoris]|uniref:sn-glycerol-3-phosphate-binding periplasmic protein UgpB n=1 Tax=Yoonia sediminilitoris TaxID=1286148 RepID=A0A2T6KPQ0_9RHOB|nr:ABC transporter substrate-binding protein [Yoonia sediminilitoris]PUB18505.1 carbohydrate ABC transporter substrate-binding protein (CUT1 family) [Yoonia sediminilitoris]RCW98673.1 carbohydrate ABC transporter substrate-binding protein (CUT1 family) [Yoonia sediminilitoris]